MPQIDVRIAGDAATAAQGWALRLQGDLTGNTGDGATGTFRAKSIRVVVWLNVGQTNDAVVAYPPAPIELPGALIVEDPPGEFRLRTLAEIGQALDARLRALRDEAVRRLRAVEVAWNFNMAAEGGAQAEVHGRFLGIDAWGTAMVRGRAAVHLRALVDGEEAAAFGDVHAEIVVQVAFAAMVSDGAGAAIQAQRQCALVLRLHGQGALIARTSLSLDCDELNLSLPGIDFDLPRFANLQLPDFQLLDLPEVAAGFEKLAGTLGKLGRYLQQGWENLNVRFAWTDGATPPNPVQPMLALRWDAANHRLLFAVARQGFAENDFALPEAQLRDRLAQFTAEIRLNGGVGDPLPIITIDRGMIARATNAQIFEARVTVQPFDAVTIPEGSREMGPLRIEWAEMPFRLEVSPIAVGAPEPANVTLRAVLKVPRIAISLRNDPGTVLALAGEIEITPSGARLLALRLLEPYPFVLITEQAAQALLRGAQQVLQMLAQWRPVSAEDLAGVRETLRVLGKLAGAVAHGAVFAATAVADLLSRAAVAVAELVGALFEKLVDLAATMSPAQLGIDSELRVGLEPFELRQVMLTLRGTAATTEPSVLHALGFRLEIAPGWQPALLLDFVNEPGAYFLAVRDPGANGPLASLSTDLWLRTSPGGPLEATRDAQPESGARPDPSNNGSNEKPLLEVTASDRRGGDIAFVLAGLRRGRAVFLKRALQSGYRATNELPVAIRVLDGPFVLKNPDAGDLDFKVEFQAERVLPFFGMGETGESFQFLEKLKEGLGQVVSVKGTDGPKIEDRKAKFGLILEVKAAGLTTEVRLGLVLSLDTFEVEFEGADTFPLKSRRIEERALGLVWIVEQANEDERARNEEIEMFRMSFANGESGFELNTGAPGEAGTARMELHFDALSSDGTGVVLRVETFRVGRGGLDLVAKVTERPVRLNGLDVPFRFTSGGLTIRAGRLAEAMIAGRGQLPPALIGEADCTVSLVFAQGAGGIVLQSGKVEIDKKGEPIVCHATRFTLTLTDLDIGFAVDGGYHFYFLVTGTLRFTPKPGEFTDGLLKYLDDVEFLLERVPLTGDPRVLVRHISFQKTLNPKREVTLFNIFRFELRGFGYHPAAPKFDGSPAINISGQISMGLGDIMQPQIDFHGLWIAPPRTGESLPRIRADGLGIELNMAGSVKVRGTLLAVDPETRTVEGREFIPPGFEASGFLGEGALDIPGWGSMQATLGFLEVAPVERPEERKNAFFFYLQANQLAIEIPTPFWTFYLREVGFGFGYRYTLAGIKQAERATSPAQLIKTLDEVSKTQGDLHRFSAWNPDPEGTKFTLALKGAIQAAPAEDSYDEDREKRVQNPFFFDLVVALRSDFTFLMSARIHLAVNYFSYQKNKGDFRSRPHLRGFFYISVPRRELLLRSVSDPKGYIGDDFALFHEGSPLRLALQGVQYSSTLYIRPGLFQYELGWPDQLSVTLSDQPNLRLRVYGGMIFRAAEDGLLYGFNLGAEAYLRFEGRVGSRVGVAVRAELSASLAVRLIAYLAWRFKDSLVYALVALEARLSFSVEAWVRFRFFKLSVRFSFSVFFSAAVELALSPGGIGAHVHARIGVQFFGRTLSVGIGFTFNNGRLEEARARVARFMAMSLLAEEPPATPVFAAKAGDGAMLADAQAQQQIAAAPVGAPPEEEPEDLSDARKDELRAQWGRPLAATDFWVVLRRAERGPRGEAIPEGQTRAYALLVPKEGRLVTLGGNEVKLGGFYVAPHHITAPNPPWQRDEVAAGAHTITANTPFDLEVFIPAPGAAGAWARIQNSIYPAPIKWSAPMPSDGAESRFTLAHMFDECFLTDTTWTVPNTDPPADAGDRIPLRWFEPKELRVHGRPLPLDQHETETREQARYAKQRDAAADAAQFPFDEQVFQARSTVLGLFIEQFTELARTGVVPPTAPGDNVPRAHVTDLGLVFYGSPTELLKLNGAAILKSDGSPGAGNVELFNPRTDWFDNVDPLLADERQAVESDGIKLGWRLELPFANAAGAGDRANPEQFLHYYEITRTIEGLDFEPVTVQVKPAASLGKCTDPNTGEMEVAAPDWQFIDSLDGELAVPAELRAALLPAAAGADSLAAAIAWLRAFPGREEVTFAYTVTPVDTAGVRGLPKSFAVDLRRPEPTIRPALAELRIRQEIPEDERAAAPTTPPDDLQIYVGLTDPAWDRDPGREFYGKLEYEITRHYRLIAQHEDIEPAGHYGSDGVTSRLRSPSTLDTAPHADEVAFEFSFAKHTRPTSPKPGEESTVPGPFAGLWINQEIEPDDETRTRIGRWARLTADRPTGDELPNALTAAQLRKLLDTIWTRRSGGRVATRFALETVVKIHQVEGGGLVEVKTYTSHRVVVPIDHVIRSLRTVIAPGQSNVLQTATIRPQAFEWPEVLRLPAPGPGQVQAESGFARFRVPSAYATLADWLTPPLVPPGATPERPLFLVRDPERRILTSVRFAAVPERIHHPANGSTLARPDAALIASYDLYELDLDGLASTGQAPPPLPRNAEAWCRARRVGRIEQLTADDARLVPDSNHELNSWQAHYPSETARLLGRGNSPGDRPLLGAWYSARESTAHFPQRRPRLRFFPQAPEDAIADLLRGGQPTELRFRLRAPDGTNAAKLVTPQTGPPWFIPAVKLIEGRIGGRDLSAEFNVTPPANPGDATIVRPTPNEVMGPRHIRHALLAAGFVAFQGVDETVENNPLHKWLEDPTVLDGLEVEIEGVAEITRRRAFEEPPGSGNFVIRDDPHQFRTGQITLALDLRSPVHPLLEELIGELAYRARDNDKLFRADQVMVQPPPAITATKLDSFLAATLPEADPYGWGILQSLGLAAALRLFDTGADRFVSPRKLAERVNDAFTDVLARWETHFPALVGQPFVEIHLKPGRDREAGPFDSVLGENGEPEAPAFELDDDGLSLVQISLRPRPAGVWSYWTLGLRWARLFTDSPGGQVDPPFEHTQITPTSWPVPDPAAWRILKDDGTPVILTNAMTIHGVIVTNQRVRGVRLSVTTPTMGVEIGRRAGGPAVVLTANATEGFVPLPSRPTLAAVQAGTADETLNVVLRMPRLLDAQNPPQDVAPQISLACLLDREKTIEVRVDRIEGSDEVGPFQVVETPEPRDTTSATLPIALGVPNCPLAQVGDWTRVAEPLAAEDEPDPFERFDVLKPAEWAAAFGAVWAQDRPTPVQSIATAVAAYRDLRRALRAAAPGVTVPDETELATELPPQELGAKDIPPLAGLLVLWLQRFLDYAGVAAPGPLPRFALAAPIKALPWKLAPAADGTLSLGLLHSDRWSHSRAYAVQPISRYHHLLAGLGLVEQKKAESLVPASGPLDAELGCGVAVSPRTEKIEPPVMLGTRRIGWPGINGEENDVVEIVVARHGEESLAFSNRALFARLGVPTSLLSFARLYRQPEWRERLRDMFPKRPLQDLPTRAPVAAARPADEPAKQITGEVIAAAVQEYPQLWKGAQIWRFDPIPPHYKLAAFAAERAGIVVSKLAGVVQDDLPRRPIANRQPELMPAEENHPRDTTLTLRQIGNEIRLVLRHPLLSHAHLTPIGAAGWLDGTNRADIAWWPDPDVAYVLQRRGPHPDNTAAAVVEEDLEVRLGAFPREWQPLTRYRLNERVAHERLIYACVLEHDGQSETNPPALDGAHWQLVPEDLSLAELRARGTLFDRGGVAVASAADHEPTEADPAPIHFFLESPLRFREPVTLQLVRLEPAEWGDAALATHFNQQAASFAAILYPHSVTIDLAVQQNETADVYLGRLREFLTNLQAAVDVELAPTQPWHHERLRHDMLAALDVATGKLANLPQNPTATEIHDHVLPREPVKAVFAIGHPAPNLPGAPLQPLPTADDSEGYLRIWNLASDDIIRAFDTAAFPPLSRAMHVDHPERGRLRKILARRLTGTAKSFWLRVIDGRARLRSPQDPMPTPGLFERQITLPDWLRHTLPHLP